MEHEVTHRLDSELGCLQTFLLLCVEDCQGAFVMARLSRREVIDETKLGAFQRLRVRQSGVRPGCAAPRSNVLQHSQAARTTGNDTFQKECSSGKTKRPHHSVIAQTDWRLGTLLAQSFWYVADHAIEIVTGIRSLRHSRRGDRCQRRASLVTEPVECIHRSQSDVRSGVGEPLDQHG